MAVRIRLQRVALGAALLALFIGWYNIPYTTGDSVWSNMVGQWIVTHHQIPHQDLWTWTAYKQNWTPQEWGFEVLLYLANRWAGFIGVVGLMAVVSSATWWALAELLEFRGVVYSRFIAFGLAVLSLPWDQIRAEIFSYLLFTLFLLQIERYRKDGRLQHLTWLIPMMVVWVNLHGSFVLGIGLVVWTALAQIVPSFDVGWIRHGSNPERFRALCVTTALLILVGLLNPQTWHLYVFSLWLSFTSHVSQYILEWQPAVVTEWYTAIALGLVLIGIAIKLTEKRPLSLFRTAWFIGSVVMFLHSVRFGSYFIVALPWQLGPTSEFQWVSRPKWKSLYYPAVLAIAIGTSGIVVREGIGVHGTLRTNAASILYPPSVKVVERLHQEHPTWKLWNAYDLGGTLEAAGIPVSVDGRTELYLADGEMKTFINASMARAGALQTLNRDGVNYVCMDNTAPLVQLLKASPEWEFLYKDKYYSVFVSKEVLHRA